MIPFSIPRVAVATPQWSLSPDCGTRAQFEEALRARIGDETSGLLDKTTLDLSVTRDGYALTVRVGDQVRKLSDHSCRDLFRAAIVVAVAFHNGKTEASEEPPPDDPGTGSRPSHSSVASTSDPNSPTSPASPPLETPPAPPRLPAPASNVNVSPARLSQSTHPPTLGHFQLQAVLGVLVGRVPQVRPTLGLAFGYERQRVGLELEGRYVPSSEASDDQGLGVRVYALGGSLRMTYRLDSSYGVQAGVFAYRLTGHGVGVTSSATSSVVAIGPQVGVWWTPWESGAWLARLTGNVEFNTLRSRFELVDNTNVFSSSRVAFLGGLAVGRKF